jgi:uncharacterized protein (TIGR02145 family)
MKNVFSILVFILFALVNHTCKKDNPKLPNITTTAVTEISYTSAKSGGEITSEGESPINSRGVCWNTSGDPTVSDNKTTESGRAGSYIANITQLIPYTLYYLRAFATNNSGTAYGEQFDFTTLIDSVSDVDGNIYKVVTIGTQVWMGKNLNTTKFNDNSPISKKWKIPFTPAYCYWNNDSTIYSSLNGALYNLYSVQTGKLCPTGWHVSSDADWSLLTTYLGGSCVAGGKLKEADTTNLRGSDTEATNETGFSAYLAGYRPAYGSFYPNGWNGMWWSCPDVSTIPIVRTLTYKSSVLAKFDNTSILDLSMYGCSVRCVKDN